MATAGTVTIKLDGDSATLIRELNKANTASKSTFGQMKREAADVAKQFAVIATAAAAAFAALTKASFESIDELAKTADRLGISTEALSVLRVAADLAGVSQEMLTKALQKQQKALVDASDGLVTTARAFERLGLNVQALIKMPADQQLFTIANAIAGVDNVTRRNALAFEIWGARMGEMINFAKGGAAASKELRQLLEDLNATVSRFDASKIEQANDAVTIASAAFKGLGNTIAVAVAPYVTQIAKDFTEAARTTHGFKAEVLEAMTGAATAVGFFADRSRDTGVAIRIILATVTYVASSIAAAFSVLGTNINALFVQPLLTALATVLHAAGSTAGFLHLDGMAASAKTASDEVRGVAASIQDAAQSAQDFADNLKMTAIQFADEIEATNKKPMLSDGINAWLKKANAAAEEAAAAMAAAGGDGKGGGDGDPTKAGTTRNLYAQKLIKPKIDVPKIDMPKMPYLDPDFVRDAAALSGEQYLAQWKLVYEQQLVAENELRQTLFDSDEAAGAALIELAAAQAREKVIAEWQARGQAISETGETADPAAQAAFELAVKEQMLASEADLLNRRMAMQQQFGGQYLNLQRSIAALTGKAWADGHKKTLANTAVFAGAAMSITQSLFGQNKKVSIAMAIISTLQGAAQALRDVPYPANLAAAASVLASGYAQVNAIKSTNIGSTGIGGGIGGGGGAPTAQPISNNINDAQENRRSAIQVVFQGDVVGWDDFMRDRFVSSLRDLVDGNDVILFGSDSRQAAEIRGG